MAKWHTDRLDLTPHHCQPARGHMTAGPAPTAERRPRAWHAGTRAASLAARFAIATADGSRWSSGGRGHQRRAGGGSRRRCAGPVTIPIDNDEQLVRGSSGDPAAIFCAAQRRYTTAAAAAAGRCRRPHRCVGVRWSAVARHTTPTATSGCGATWHGGAPAGGRSRAARGAFRHGGPAGEDACASAGAASSATRGGAHLEYDTCLAVLIWGLALKTDSIATVANRA